MSFTPSESVISVKQSAHSSSFLQDAAPSIAANTIKGKIFFIIREINSAGEIRRIFGMVKFTNQINHQLFRAPGIGCGLHCFAISTLQGIRQETIAFR